MSTILDFTKPHVLRNAAEYNAAIEEIDQLLDLDPAPATEDYERLEFLSLRQIEALKKHLGIPADLLIGKHTIDD